MNLELDTFLAKSELLFSKYCRKAVIDSFYIMEHPVLKVPQNSQDSDMDMDIPHKTDSLMDTSQATPKAKLKPAESGKGSPRAKVQPPEAGHGSPTSKARTSLL